MIMKICIESALIILIASASIVSVSCTFCPEGMIWSKCGHHKSCDHPQGPKGYVAKCGPPGCTCSLHLVMREKDRKCVKKEECSGSLTTVSPPKVTTPPKITTPAPVGKCPEGMFLDVCGHHKCRFSCTHPLGPKGCVPKCGPPGCTCLLHLVMRETDGKCVKKEECSGSLTTVSPPKVTTPSKVTTPPKVTTPATQNPTTHPPQKQQQPYRPQPGLPYPDKPCSPKIPSYPQGVPPHTGKFPRKCKDSRKDSSGGSSQRIRGRKCRRGRFSHGKDDDEFE